MKDNKTISKAQQKAVNKYIKNNYERVNLTLKKGRKEIIKEHALKNGESINSFINRAIEEAIARDKIGAFNSNNNKDKTIKITRFSEIEDTDSGQMNTNEIESRLNNVNWD